MNGKIITICVLALVTIPVLTATANDRVTFEVSTSSNTPIIEGPTNGIIGNVYEYTVTFEDSQGDDIYYTIRWGDCMIIKNAGPYESGEEVQFSHAWCEVCCGPGTFTICVQATDDNGDHSNWGTLEVTMGKNKDSSSYNSLFQFFFEKLMERFPVFEKLLGF